MNVGYFIADSLHYIPSILPLMNQTGGVLISFNRHAGKFIKEDEKNFDIIHVRNYKSLLRDLESLKLNIMVHPSFSVQYFKNCIELKHVQIFHGISDKPFSFHKSLKRYDLIIVPGPKKKNDIIRKCLADADKIKVIGYPKIDYFLHSNFDREAFKLKIGIDVSKKTILYSPTWIDPNSFSSFPKYIISILRDLKDYNVIVKPHPNILKYRPWQIVKAYMMKKKNCYIFLKSISVLPFMAISDIMITDISSVAQEFLPFDKPIVFINPKPQKKIPEEHTWIWHCGDVIAHKSGILHFVKENIDNPHKYKKERREAQKKIFYNFDGKSARRFKDALMNLQTDRK